MMQPVSMTSHISKGGSEALRRISTLRSSQQILALGLGGSLLSRLFMPRCLSILIRYHFTVYLVHCQPLPGSTVRTIYLIIYIESRCVVIASEEKDKSYMRLEKAENVVMIVNIREKMGWALGKVQSISQYKVSLRRTTSEVEQSDLLYIRRVTSDLPMYRCSTAKKGMLAHLVSVYEISIQPIRSEYIIFGSCLR